MEKGTYIKPDGSQVQVLEFDPVNKMVYTPLPNGNFQWVHDTEYNSWVREGYVEPTIEEQVEELAAQTEEPKKKKTTKKKAE